MPSELRVIYEDPHILVLDKPAGLLAVPGRGEAKQDCLSARAQAVYPDALVVHRLDMATSGLMVMGRGIDAQRRLSQAFAAREVHKRYVAVVDGHLAGPANAWQLIDLPIRVDWPRRPLRIIDALEGQASQTRWQAISHDASAGTTRLLLEPVTGRSHQLRVHLLSLGHPILGDMLYANPSAQALSQRMLLHACRLELAHPTSGERMRFDSPVPF
jgi:tRNA pseudouridine32 synthase / 23S rRNA pseudouridine746 synthase